MILPDEQELLQHSERTDALTGLLDLNAFRSALRQRLDRHERVAVIYFNIQNFKGYNEKFGFDEGNVLLNLVADAIRHAYPGASAGRSSADQFEVACDPAAVKNGIMQVRRAFRAHVKDSSIWLKAGFYVATDPTEDESLICDRAKLACDTIKGMRNVFYREYDQQLRDQIARRRFVLDRFDEALAKGHIKVYYQPIVRVATGEVCDEEALSRWDDPETGIINPADFIPALEDARLINKLDLYVVRRACEHVARLRKRGVTEDIPAISINLSRLDFELCDIVTEIEKILVYYDTPRSALSIEVTESALTGNQEFLKGEIDRFRADGFEVWMDDFGSGYSSLNLLKDYSFDLIKLDMGFLRGFETNDDSRVLLANVINLAKELGLKTLVEGVETAEQYHFLQGLGCGRAQGFYFGRPQQIADLERAIATGKYLPIEHKGEQEFFEQIARVNLMRPTPVDDIDGHYVPGDIPAAIVMHRRGMYTYLNATDVYREFLRAIGAPTLEDSAERLNDPSRVEHNRLNEALAQASATGDWAWTTYFESGKYSTLRVKVIASEPESESVACLLIGASIQEATFSSPAGIGALQQG